jgi:hypothetical protein
MENTIEQLIEDQVNVCTNISLMVLPRDQKDVLTQIKQAGKGAAKLWLRYKKEAIEKSIDYKKETLASIKLIQIELLKDFIRELNGDAVKNNPKQEAKL